MAATVIRVAGVIDRVDFLLSGSFRVGEPYNLEFDWTGPGNDSIPDPGQGLYRDAGRNFELRTPLYRITSAKAGYSLTDRVSPPFNDSYYFGAAQHWTTQHPGVPLVGSYLIGDLFPYWAAIELEDPSGQAFSSDDLLGPVPTLSDFQSAQLVLRFAAESSSVGAFQVSSLYGTVRAVRVVPEPDALSLVSAGILAWLSLAWLGLAWLGLRRS